MWYFVLVKTVGLIFRPSLFSQWTEQNRQRAHSVGLDPLYCYQAIDCKQQLIVKMTCCATCSATCCATFFATCYLTCCPTCCPTCCAPCCATCCPTCYFYKQLLFTGCCLITIGYIQANRVNCLHVFCFVHWLCCSPVYFLFWWLLFMGVKKQLWYIPHIFLSRRSIENKCDIFGRYKQQGKSRHMSMLLRGNVCFFCGIV